MFGLPIVQISTHVRPTLGEGLGEIVATFGLILVVLLALKYRPESIPVAVAAYITSAYWFTSLTSFANPAVTFSTRDDGHLCRHLAAERAVLRLRAVTRRRSGRTVCALVGWHRAGNRGKSRKLSSRDDFIETGTGEIYAE
jgi:hypothetical protein